MTAHARERSVPLARRQLGAERGKLMLAIIGVALSVALVGLLLGLRAGIAKQVTRYEDRSGAQVYVGGAGARDLVVTDSVVPGSLAARIERLAPGTDAAPITANLEMLTMHNRKQATLVIGAEPGRLGGPWRMRAGRAPPKRGNSTIALAYGSLHSAAVGTIVLHIQHRVLRSRPQDSVIPSSRASHTTLAERGDLHHSYRLNPVRVRADKNSDGGRRS